jgi:hypothetical protein
VSAAQRFFALRAFFFAGLFGAGRRARTLLFALFPADFAFAGFRAAAFPEEVDFDAAGFDAGGLDTTGGALLTGITGGATNLGAILITPLGATILGAFRAATFAAFSRAISAFARRALIVSFSSPLERSTCACESR